MVLEATRLDVSTMPDLARLAEEVAQSGRTLVLQHGDRDLAVLMPAGSHKRKHQKIRTLTAEQREAFLSSAGGWVGVVDADQFKHDMEAARSDRRSPLNL